MKDTIQTTLIMETQPELIQKTCQTLSSSLEDFLAKLSVLLENEKDLTKQEEHYFLRLQGFSETNNQGTFYSKTLKAYYLMRGGATLETIFRVCDELGYDVSWAIYNSCDYGVPQNRERIFIKGYSRRECGRKVLSVPRVNKSVDEPMSNTYYGTRAGRVHKEDEIMNTLSCQGHNGGGSQLIQLNNDKQRPQGQRIYDDNGLAVTLNAAANNNWYKINRVRNVGMTVRKLTPIECERLQGFPDNWTKYGKDDELISDTQRYKCCGNAVTTNVITAIVNEMLEGVEG